MIHIAGLILKIIGIVLLVLLLFLLFCIVTLFGISARYHGSIQVQEGASARLVINGPLFFYRLWVEFKDGSLQYRFRIFGIPVLKNGKERSTKEKITKKKNSKKKNTKKKTAEKRDNKEPQGFFEKIKYTFYEFCGKIKGAWNYSKELITLLEKDVTKDALRDLKKEISFFLKIFRPKKLEGYVEFGTGDPASTGQLLGMISVFYFGYFPDVALYPIFNERKFSTELFVKGRLSLGKVLGCLLRLYGNRKIKYVLKKISNLGGNKYVK